MSRWFVAPLVVAALLFAPFLLKRRDLVVSTPSPRPLFNVTFIPVHGRLCASDVTIPHDARELRYATRATEARRAFTPPPATRLGTLCLKAQADLVGTAEARTQSRPRYT